MKFQILVDYSALDSEQSELLLCAPYEVKLICPDCEGAGELVFCTGGSPWDTKAERCELCRGDGTTTNHELADHFQAIARATIRASTYKAELSKLLGEKRHAI